MSWLKVMSRAVWGWWEGRAVRRIAPLGYSRVVLGGGVDAVEAAVMVVEVGSDLMVTACSFGVRWTGGDLARRLSGGGEIVTSSRFRFSLARRSASIALRSRKLILLDVDLVLTSLLLGPGTGATGLRALCSARDMAMASLRSSSWSDSESGEDWVRSMALAILILLLDDLEKMWRGKAKLKFLCWEYWKAEQTWGVSRRMQEK